MSVLRILVDESASAEKWGVGVVIEHNQKGFHFGGYNSELGACQEEEGQSNSSVIGTFGMYLACSVAAEYMNKHPGERCAVDIVVDVSASLAVLRVTVHTDIDADSCADRILIFTCLSTLSTAPCLRREMAGRVW